MDWQDTMGSEEIEKGVEFRPTLVIGLGGTGHEVLVRLKARFVDTFGEDVFRVVKLISFDTADETIPVTAESGRMVSLVKETELVNIGHVPVESLIKNLDRHSHIKAWLPDKLPPRAITAGAKMIRPLGRLALFYHYDHDAKIRDRLQSIIRALANIKLKDASVGEGAQVARTRGVNVFIVSSVCGGTGSGTFLDMAYLTRELLRQNGIRAEYCYINGVLVLPEAFAMVASDAIKANAFAALQELNYYTKEGGFYARYPDGLVVDVHMRPFSICYLVDAVNENGKMLTGMEDLAPMIAESIFLQIGSQVGNATKSVFDNVKSLDNLDTEHPTAFSSLGTASLIFPADRIINTCAYRFGRQLITDGVLHTPGQINPDQVAKEFIERAKLVPKSLLVELARDDKGQQIVIRLEASALERFKDEEIAREVDRFLQMYEVRRLNGIFKQFTDRNVEVMRREATKALHDETVRLVDDPAFGPRFALLFLAALEHRLQAMLNGFGQERQKLNAQVEQNRKGVLALHQALANAAQSFIVGRSGRIAKARTQLIEAKQAEFGAAFEIRKLTLALQLIANLNTAISEHKKAVQTLVDKFESIGQRFAREAKQLEEESGRMTFVLNTDITDLNDVNRYYGELMRSVTQELTRFLDSIGSLYSLSDQNEDAIGRAIVDFAREIFDPIRTIKLEAIVKEKQDRMRPEERLEDLREDSVPFWNYDVTRMSSGGDLESIRVLGVEDRNESYYRDMIRKGEVLVTTRDRHRLTVLHSKHGLPLFALEQYELYRGKYEEHLKRQVSPLHLFKNLPWLHDDQEARQWFALAQTFDLIRKVGVWYYCKPEDELSEEIRLAQGLESAINTFVNAPELLEMVKRMIENIIRTRGNAWTVKTIDAYLQWPRSKDPGVAKLEESLQKLARAFKDQIGPVDLMPPDAQDPGAQTRTAH